MPELSTFLPLSVPIILGLVTIRLLVQLRLAYTRPQTDQGQVVQQAWGNAIVVLFFSAFFLPTLSRLFGGVVQTNLLWVALVAAVVLSLLHGMLFKAPVQQRKSAGSSAGPLAALESVVKELQQKQMDSIAPGTVSQPSTSPAGAFPNRPLPSARRTLGTPVLSAQAQAWQERQDRWLQRNLNGKELSAARLRLSSLKSMLLLGQLSLSEAEADLEQLVRSRV